MYNIPAGATPEFNAQGNLTGYETTSKVTGAITEYDYSNGQRQVSGYHVPMSELSPVSSSTHYIGSNVIHAGSSNIFGTGGYEIPGQMSNNYHGHGNGMGDNYHGHGSGGSMVYPGGYHPGMGMDHGMMSGIMGGMEGG